MDDIKMSQVWTAILFEILTSHFGYFADVWETDDLYHRRLHRFGSQLSHV